MPFGLRGGERAETSFGERGSTVKVSAVELDPGFRIILLGDFFGPAPASCAQPKKPSEKEKSYGQGRPLMSACTTLTSPESGEPSSSLSIVSVRFPNSAIISAT